MSSRGRSDWKNRRETGPFAPFPCSVLRHPNFIGLTSKAKVLVLDLLEQLRFKEGGPSNNGDLTIAWSIMKIRGWRSKETLWAAIDELEYYGFVQKTRQGGRHRCSLYGITWWAINECKGKLDVPETRAPSNKWKEVMDGYRSKRSRKNKFRALIFVPKCPDNRTKSEFKNLTLDEIWALCPEDRTNVVQAVSR